jgi:osmoprotectant transport system permease protein
VSGVWAWLSDPKHWTGDDGVPHRLIEHLLISGWALLIAAVVALPFAIAAGHVGRGGAVLAAIGNVGRAIPTYAVIVILALTDQVGVGALAVVLALALFALPPLLVNSYVAVREVDPDVKDAARGMGMTGGQLLRRVELPLAFPLAFAGFRTATVQVVATATFGSLVGAGTLGQIIINGFSVNNYDQMYAGVVVVAIVCLACDGGLAVVQRLVGRRWGQSTGRPAGLRGRRGPGGSPPAGPAAAEALATLPAGAR